MIDQPEAPAETDPAPSDADVIAERRTPAYTAVRDYIRQHPGLEATTVSIIWRTLELGLDAMQVGQCESSHCVEGGHVIIAKPTGETPDWPRGAPDPQPAPPTVTGRCPACKGESLFLADGGHVTCSRIDCPDPSAADWSLHSGLVPRLQHELRYWQALVNPSPTQEPDRLRAALTQVGRLHTSEISNEYGATECRTCRDQWPCDTAVIVTAETHASQDQAPAGYCPHCGRGDAGPTADQYEQQRKRADTAESKLAALHEGEEPAPDENTVPTPAQWLWRWNRATPERRLDMAGRILQAFGEANRCFMEAHVSRAEDGRVAMAALGRVRGELDRWALNTVMPQTSRALDDIRTALEQPKKQS